MGTSAECSSLRSATMIFPILALCLLGAGSAAQPIASTNSGYVPPEKTELKRLPGWAYALPSRQFTGHLNVGAPPSGVGTMYFHYWLIDSENDPATDPVIFWYNGGPGASSLFGLLQEMGPLLLNEASFDLAYNLTGVPTMQKNPYSWTQFATIVAIDSPLLSDSLSAARMVHPEAARRAARGPMTPFSLPTTK